MAARSADILLVEDNSDDEVLTVRVLQQHLQGRSVHVARDGVEALDFLYGTGTDSDRGSAELPRVVLLDLKLPRVDGLQVLARIRAEERTRYLPVVVLTSSDEVRDIADSYRQGANAYVRKPVKFAEFSEAIRTLGLFWLVANRTV